MPGHVAPMYISIAPRLGQQRLEDPFEMLDTCILLVQDLVSKKTHKLKVYRLWCHPVQFYFW